MNPLADELARCRAAQCDWATLSVPQRLRPVRRFRHMLADSAEDVLAAVARDLDRPAVEVIAADILPTADACRFLERRAARLLRPRRVSWWDRPLWFFGQRDTVFHRPRGVVGVIGTWNFPVLLNGIQIVQALTAGNGVLWKPSEVAPATAAVLHGLFVRAGFPADLLQRLPATRDGGPQLAEADIDHVVFTGSAAVGRKLASRLGERLVSSTLELSGCDAMFVRADADVELAARAAWFGATLNRGQACIAVRRVFVARERYAEFLAALEPLVTDSAPVPLKSPVQVEQGRRIVLDAVAGGARVLGKPASADGSFFPPTALIDVRPDMTLFREAPFAPLLGVLPYDTDSAALADNAECPYGLGASVFSADTRGASDWAARIPAGMVTINDAIVPTAHPATPFGGRRSAGWGVTQGAEGLLAMTLPQTVSVRRGTFRPHYDMTKPTPVDEEIFAGLLASSHGGSVWRRCRGLMRLLRGGRSWLKQARP